MIAKELSLPHAPAEAPMPSGLRCGIGRLAAWFAGRSRGQCAADLDPHMLRDMGLPPEVDAWSETEALRRRRCLSQPNLW